MRRRSTEIIYELYAIKEVRAEAEHAGSSSIASYIIGTAQMELNRDAPESRVRIQEFFRESIEIKAALRPEHDPWLFETGHGALAEDPPDWRVANLVLRIGCHIEHHNSIEQLVRKVLEKPIRADTGGGQTDAIRHALGCLLLHWPEDAASIFETVLTLPHQPAQRAILPIADTEPRPETLEEDLVITAAHTLRRLEYFPERAEELLARIEVSLKANAYTLDDKAAEALDRLRSRLDELES